MPFTVTFSEEVTGFAYTDITIDNGSTRTDRNFHPKLGIASDAAKDIWQKRVKVIIGDSTSEEVEKQLLAFGEEQGLRISDANCMVFLDSNHKEAHVAKELEIYWKYVTKGYHLIIEDTNISKRHHREFYPGPYQAVEKFLNGKHGCKFKTDKFCERFVITTNPNGFLLRV